MKKAITWIVWLLVLISLVYLYHISTKAELPVVGTNGEVKGEYAISNIMALGKPYRCTFEKKDETSMIQGVLTTDALNIYGEFKINTKILEESFRTFLLVRGKESYIWTSLQNVGFKSRVTNSATKNASPEEQAQIVGLKDKLELSCSPLAEIDPSTFEVPSSIEFVSR